MASLEPQQCCFEGIKKEGATKGAHTELYGHNVYVAGSQSTKVIVMFTDIFGYEFPNNMLIADRFAQNGYYTIMPDLFDGEPITEGTDRDAWRERHKKEDIAAKIDDFLASLKKDVNYEFLAVTGHCFGAKFAIQQISDSGYASCAAIAHPSGVTIEEVAEITKPLLISGAETDRVFPEELRYQTEAKLKENKIIYQIDIFSGTTHGYAVRGDESVPQIKYAKEKTFLDQVLWFNRFSE